MNKVIGGEFEIDLSNIKDSCNFGHSITFSTGRAAFFHILKLLNSNYGYKKILLPDYLCESIIDAVKKCRLQFDFYNVNFDLSINFESLNSIYSNDHIVLFINYFGCIDIENNISIIRKSFSDACIISDNVQAYYAMNKLSKADFSFTSFRKTFPTPDGAFVNSLWKGLDILTESNTFLASKALGGILKFSARNNDLNDHLYLNFFDEGEKNIDSSYFSPMSEFSKLIFSGLDLDKIAAVRRENAIFLLKGLREINVDPIIADIKNYVPLFVPIRIPNRDEVRRRMFLERIYLPVHWPNPKNLKLNRAGELSTSELSLIVDQRYSINDMEKVLNMLVKFL